MANDLATLTSHLATALRDDAHATWTLAEKQNLITWSVSSLSPAIEKYTTYMMAAPSNSNFITVPADSGLTTIHRIDLWDADPTSEVSRMMQEVPGRAWEIQGVMEPGSTARVAINPGFAIAGYYFLIHGYAPYNTDTRLIPDDLVPLVLAKARAEAYRRMGGDRARFENWLTQNERQDVSVNELLQLTREAQAEADSLMYRSMGRRKPVTARR